jgi:hypothetical protein
MRYSVIVASLAAVAVAVPTEMKDMEMTNTMNEMKPNDDFKDYTNYGAYGKYGTYANYPEEATNVQGTHFFCFSVEASYLHYHSKGKHEARQREGRCEERCDDEGREDG